MRDRGEGEEEEERGRKVPNCKQMIGRRRRGRLGGYLNINMKISDGRAKVPSSLSVMFCSGGTDGFSD